MSKSAQLQKVRSYLVKYLRLFSEYYHLLYKIYCKPFTFQKEIASLIHQGSSHRSETPTTKDNFNNISMYEKRIMLLNIIIPISIVLFTSLILTLIAHVPFDWFFSLSFFIGWGAGLQYYAYLSRNTSNSSIANASDYSKIVSVNYSADNGERVSFYLILGSFIALLASLSGLTWFFLNEIVYTITFSVNAIEGFFLNEITYFIVKLLIGLTVGLFLSLIISAVIVSIKNLSLILTIALPLVSTVGVLAGLAFGLTVGVLAGLAFGLTVGVLAGLAFGLTVGSILNWAYGSIAILATNLLFGLLLGLAFGQAVGLTAGTAIGLTATLAATIGSLRICFWSLELLWMISLSFPRKQRPGENIHKLRRLPQYSDELIFLPLPFVTQIVVKAYHENPIVTRQTIDYLTTSTNQQRIAAQVMVSIVVETLYYCQTISDIGTIADQLSWMPSPPPKGVGSFLPQFLEISQSVRAIQTTRSPYRKHKQIQEPVTTLRGLLNSLALGSTPWEAATFGHIAQHWLAILDTAQRHLEEQAAQSEEIPQEYIAGPALSPESAGSRFKGRMDVFNEIEKMVFSDQPTPLLLYGGRRTGKTSVLRYLPRHTGADLTPLLIDVQGAATSITLKGFAKEIADRIVEAARQARNMRLPHPDPSAFESDPFPALLEWMRRVEESVPKKRFLLCFDEYERISEVVESVQSRVPLNFLRHIIQHRGRWIVLLSGSHTLEVLAPYWSDYLINVRTVQVSYLDESAARELILRPIEGFPDIYEEEAVQAILYLTRCQPYLVQLLCYVLVEQLNRKKKYRATAHDVYDLIPQALAEGSMYFREFWQALLPQERDFLLRLTQGEVSEDEEKYIKQKLVQQEILEKDLHFQVPLLRMFVEQQAKEMR